MWIVITLVSLAILVILILCLPLGMVLRIDVYDRPKFQMRLVWLFGLISKEVKRGSKKAEEPERVTEEKQKRKARRIRAGTVFQILRTKGLLRQFTRLLKGIFGCIKIRDIAADFTVGLGDPADTGLLFAIIGPVTFFLAPSFAQRIRVRPSFEDAVVLQGYLGGTMRLQPIQLVQPFLRFTFSVAAMRAVKTLVVTKWKRKRR